jgi:hypothetical protein
MKTTLKVDIKLPIVPLVNCIPIGFYFCWFVAGISWFYTSCVHHGFLSREERFYPDHDLNRVLLLLIL